MNAEEAEDILRLSGNWTVSHLSRIEKQSWPDARVVDAGAIDSMDTAGALLFSRLFLRQGKAEVRGMKPDHRHLLDLLEPCRIEEEKPPTPGFLAGVGISGMKSAQQMLGMLSFLGEVFLVFLRSMAKPSNFRLIPLWHNLQHAGFNAIPIAGLLSFLMGIVIAYQGAEQLSRYGANIFVVDLVGLSMLRELSPLLTAIIVAGRSGSAFTAQIGTMKVTDEIDALETTGISPFEQLVLPKILALAVALPLLTVYTDICGVLGGMVMAHLQLGVSYVDFLDRFGTSIKLSAFLIGVGKAPVFAGIIAVVGCFQGFLVSGGADSVGRQTTQSVVQSIFLVIVADAFFSVIFSMMHL